MKKWLAIFFIFWASFLVGEEVVSLTGLNKPQYLVVDGQQVFITEGATVYIYSAPGYKLQKKFGKRGEGPGEFKESGEGITLAITPSEIIVNSIGRISFFTRNGEFKRESRTTNTRGYNFISLGDKYVGTFVTFDKDKRFFTLTLCDAELNKEKELYAFPHPFFPRTKKINAVDIRVSSSHVYGDKIFVDDSDGNILVYNEKGEKVKTISPTYEEIPVTAKHKKWYLEIWQTSLRPEYQAFKERLKFPVIFPKIRDYQVIDGQVYIITYKEKDDKSQVFVYSLDGQLKKTLYLPLAETDMLLPPTYNYYTIKNEKLYRLVENLEKEEWQLHITPLN